ncbi:MAG: hypothetical protein KAX80_15910 [Planctomycetes bacterium]|nr:hypothetical protein [Planctomycetota bacterium]
MLKATISVGCDVEGVSFWRNCRVVISLRGNGELAGTVGTVRGTLTFRPSELSPREADLLGSSIAFYLLSKGDLMELVLGEPGGSEKDKHAV